MSLPDIPFLIRRHSGGVPFAVLQEGRYILFGGGKKTGPLWILDPDQIDPEQDGAQARSCPGVWTAEAGRGRMVVLKQSSGKHRAILYLWSPGCSEQNAGFYTEGDTVAEVREAGRTGGTVVKSRLVLCKPGERLFWMNGKRQKTGNTITARIAGAM